jgi:adenosine deaminase
MQKTLSSLTITLALALAANAQAASPKANEAATARHLAALTAGANPRLAGLTLFFSQMPKGGDLHHHYSGAIYAEQYLDFLERQGYCVNKQSYRIETAKAVIEAEQAKPASERNCLSASEVVADDFSYRELLQRWSSKDFHNHGAIQAPPDRQFFQTFAYFNAVSNVNFHEGLLELKKRAVIENVGYIETMFKSAPSIKNAEFDAVAQRAGADDAAFTSQMRSTMAMLEADPAYQQRIVDYVAKIAEAAEGIDDANFTMRYQSYVFRLLAPSQVFSSMLAGFKAATLNPLIVGVNIVGQESQAGAMRDYTMHMKMFGFLKQRYPGVKVALHAGELALGDVPPDGLGFHIDQALALGGADRIGHGIDLAHESNAAAIMKTMRARDVPVEINLTSNEFISGIKGDNHPVTLYRKYGVPVVLGTDDAGVTRHNLAQEYVLFASRYRPDYAELKRVSYNGLRYAFLPAVDKQRLTRQLDARFARFEADIAALDAVASGKPARHGAAPR